MSNPNMTQEQVAAMAAMQEELNKLKAENAKLKATNFTASNKLTLKVSEKGAVSIYSLRRFPVTLYADEWKRVLDIKGDILNFIETGLRSGVLKSKATDEDKAAA